MKKLNETVSEKDSFFRDAKIRLEDRMYDLVELSNLIEINFDSGFDDSSLSSLPKEQEDKFGRLAMAAIKHREEANDVAQNINFLANRLGNGYITKKEADAALLKAQELIEDKIKHLVGIARFFKSKNNLNATADEMNDIIKKYRI